MRIKENFVKRQIAGEYLVIPLGEERDRVHGIIKLNDAGSLLWDVLSEERSIDDLVCFLVNNYGLKEEEAKQDVGQFINQLMMIGCLTE